MVNIKTPKELDKSKKNTTNDNQKEKIDLKNIVKTSVNEFKESIDRINKKFSEHSKIENKKLKPVIEVLNDLKENYVKDGIEFEFYGNGEIDLWITTKIGRNQAEYPYDCNSYKIRFGNPFDNVEKEKYEIIKNEIIDPDSDLYEYDWKWKTDNLKDFIKMLIQEIAYCLK